MMFWFRTVLVYLLFVTGHATALENTTSMTAPELLSTFSGVDSSQHAPLFRFTDNSRIVSIEIHAVGMENTTAKYSGTEDAWREVNNIMRIRTADGFEGISGVDTYYQGPFSGEHLETLRSAAADLVAIRSLDPVEVSSALRKSRPDLSDEARASIDIALWDLAARKADKPLSELLGAKRTSIEAYASLPFYDTLPEYIEAVNNYKMLGLNSFKFHVWGSIDADIELVKLVQKTFKDSDYRFMIDLESVYDFDDAQLLGAQMDKGLFLWLEAPIQDQLLQQYAALRQELDLQIIPAGYSVYSAEFISKGIQAGAWDSARFDATVVGGISEALNLLVIANAADLPVDIQSWGHSLAQAANLHLMLANPRTQYFEVAMPKEVFEFGMDNGGLLQGGKAVMPDAPGLGLAVDWERLKTADFYATAVIEF